MLCVLDINLDVFAINTHNYIEVNERIAYEKDKVNVVFIATLLRRKCFKNFK